MPHIQFAENLQHLQKARNLKLRQISKGTGISEASLSNYTQHGNEPTLGNLVAIADFFEVPLDTLVFGDNEDRRPQIDIEGRFTTLSLRVEERVERQTRLLSRIGTIITDHMADVAKSVNSDVARLGGNILLEDEIWKIELCSNKIDVFSAYMEDEVVIDRNAGTISAGPYFPAVAKNLLDNPHVQYRYIYSSDAPFPKDFPAMFQRLLNDQVGQNVEGRVKIKIIDIPILTSCVMYQLLPVKLAEKHALINEQIRGYVSDDHWFGCVLPTSMTPHVNMIMDEQHLERARTRFSKIWRKKSQCSSN